jgi:HSP20 family protein
MARRGKPAQGPVDVGLGGILGGLGNFLEFLTSVAEREGAEFKRSGELGDERKGVKAVYGFSVRVGQAGKPVVEHFGNVKPGAKGKGPVVEEVREPMVDVFDESDHVLLVAELPGVDAQDIRFEVKGDVLSLSAAHGDRKYRKEVLLPSVVRAEAAVPSYRNGVFELKLPKSSS